MNGKSFALLFAFLIAIGTALSLALSNERPESIGTSFEDFQAHRDLWVSRRPKGYAVKVDRQCYCPIWSARVTVAGAEVKDVEFLVDRSDPSIFADARRYPRDIDTVFEIINTAYKERAYNIELTFDETYGYPVRAFIDWNHDTVDDETYFELSEFKPADGSS